jgi:signal transduction histidine kinase
MEVVLDDLTSGLTSEQGPEERFSELQRSRELLRDEWSAYEALPIYAGERELQAKAVTALQEVNASLDAALRHLQAGNEERARMVRNRQAVPALERLDATLHALVDLNAVRASEKSASIAAVWSEATSVGISLHVLSAIVAAVAGFLLLRLVRRYAHLTQLRATELEHFAGRVAHDIRSPLGSLGLTLELTKRDPRLGDQARTRLDRAGATIKRVGQLVDDMLTFAVAGAPPRHGVEANVNEVVTGVVDGIRPSAKEKDIELHVESAEGSVACEPGILMSLLGNLIRNAIKYMGDAPVRHVDIRTRHVGSMIRMEVEDTGPGVPSELRQRIFYPHVRAATSGVPGLGLGLATVRRLVEAHGGSVGVEGNPDGGSLFWFQLPRAS